MKSRGRWGNCFPVRGHLQILLGCWLASLVSRIKNAATKVPQLLTKWKSLLPWRQFSFQTCKKIRSTSILYRQRFWKVTNQSPFWAQPLVLNKSRGCYTARNNARSDEKKKRNLQQERGNSFSTANPESTLFQIFDRLTRLRKPINCRALKRDRQTFYLSLQPSPTSLKVPESWRRKHCTERKEKG